MMREGSVEELAADIEAPGKFSILLLGSGFARGAGVPGVEDVARRLLDQEGGGGKLAEAFRTRLQKMSALERYSLLRAIYRSQSIPATYRYVARIIRDCQFSHLLTCSIDLLLEEALKGVGLQVGDDYQVIDPLISSVTVIHPPSESRRLLPLVRVHDALAPSVVETTTRLVSTPA